MRADPESVNPIGTRISRLLPCAAAAGLLTVLLATAPGQGQQPTDGPGLAGSSDPDEYGTASEEPDFLEFGTDWDEVTAPIHDPTERVAESTGFDEMVVEAEAPERKQTRTFELMELSEDLGSSHLRSTPKHDEEALEPPDEDAGPVLQARWRALQYAEARLEAANAAYQDMRQTDYPRGEQRRWIIQSRDEAIEATAAARTRYAEARAN